MDSRERETDGQNKARSSGPKLAGQSPLQYQSQRFFFHLTVQVNVSLLKGKDKIGDVIYVVNSSFLTNTL